jgi:hypothetical protein
MESPQEIKINTTDIEFLEQEFEIKRDVAKSILVEAKGDIS